MTDTEYLRSLIAPLVDYPDSVQIDKKNDEMGVLLTLSVDKSDMGKIIGREGITAKSIRTVLKVFGMKNNARINLKIVEPTDAPAWREKKRYPQDYD